MIIHRQDKDWIEHRLPDDKLRKAFSEAFAEKERILINRVIDALDRFTGFTHVMCVGGGAKLISEAVKGDQRAVRPVLYEQGTSV